MVDVEASLRLFSLNQLTRCIGRRISHVGPIFHVGPTVLTHTQTFMKETYKFDIKRLILLGCQLSRSTSFYGLYTLYYIVYSRISARCLAVLSLPLAVCFWKLLLNIYKLFLWVLTLLCFSLLNFYLIL